MQGISDIITIPGLVNVDFADVKAIMSNSGTAMLGVGVSSGKNRAEEAALVSLRRGGGVGAGLGSAGRSNRPECKARGDGAAARLPREQARS